MTIAQIALIIMAGLLIVLPLFMLVTYLIYKHRPVNTYPDSISEGHRDTDILSRYVDSTVKRRYNRIHF